MGKHHFNICRIDDWGWDHNDPEDYYPYIGDYDRTNHQVVIVGWRNDNTISNGGYWIIKNSFSSEWGYNGFFNLEYDYQGKHLSNKQPQAQSPGRDQPPLLAPRAASGP